MGTLESMVLSPPIYHDICLRLHKTPIERLNLETSSNFANMQQLHHTKASVVSHQSQGQRVLSILTAL